MEINVSSNVSNKPSNGILLRKPRPPKLDLYLPSSSGQLSNSTTIQAGKSKSLTSPPEQGKLHNKNKIHDAETILNNHSNRNDFVINPLYPKGPAFFPPGKKLCGDIFPPFELPDEIHLSHHEPVHDFTLQTFQLLPMEEINKIHIGKGVISKQSYQKLTSWFAKNVPKQQSLNMLDLEVRHSAPPSRVPRKQILIELQAMVKGVMEEHPPVDSISSSSFLDEILPKWPHPNQDDALFRSSTSRYFCGQGRSDSPFDARHQPFISPHEVAMIESMMNGGSHLSLKAHFISELPAMLPLVCTLSYLNLSFNSFKIFPVELFQLHSLMFLSLRNNPLHHIPNEIKNLQNLRCLCLSFCIISELPSGFFELGDLTDLDISYNSICSLPRDLSKLRNLRKLNIEGNQVDGLPCTVLSLLLSHIILGNNLMHPILWKENTRNQPQALVDLCCVLINNTGSVPESFSSSSSGLCDECGNTVFGHGLRVIRSVEHSHYKVKNLPFIFIVCSPRCSSFLRKKSPKYWLKR